MLTRKLDMRTTQIAAKETQGFGPKLIPIGTNLLEGKLVATGQTGEFLGEIHPITTVGELGAFTGSHRSANVVAVEKSKVLIIHERMLDNLLTKNPDMHLTVVDNLIDVLAGRLTKPMTSSAPNQAPSKSYRRPNRTHAPHNNPS